MDAGRSPSPPEREHEWETSGSGSSAGSGVGPSIAVRPRPAQTGSTPTARNSPTGPVLRANPFPEVTDPICRLPLPTLFYTARGCSPWRPAADMGTVWHENHTRSLGFSRADTSAPDTARDAVLYGNFVPISGRTDSRDRRSLQRKENSSRDLWRRLRVRLRCRSRRSYETIANLHGQVREY